MEFVGVILFVLIIVAQMMVWANTSALRKIAEERRREELQLRAQQQWSGQQQQWTGGQQ